MLCKGKDSDEKCHLNQCKDCPGYYGDNGPYDQLRKEFDNQLIDKIKYKTWANCGCGAELVTLTRDMYPFLHHIGTLLTSTPHDYITKKQSNYLRDLKEKLSENDIIALVDFSENYGFKHKIRFWPPILICHNAQFIQYVFILRKGMNLDIKASYTQRIEVMF